MNVNENNARSGDRSSWLPLKEWTTRMGLSSVTVWRWRRQGWLKVVRVGSRLFLRPEDITEFEERAALGEFSKPANLKSSSPDKL
jgi:hypothetical protein